MQNDFISRKALLEIFEHDLACFESNGKKETEMFISVADMRRMITDAPTAYNPEKVVQQLEERRIDNLRCSRLDGNSVIKKASLVCRADEDDIAIKIIRNGGKE